MGVRPKAGEYGRACGMCFVVRRLELVADAGLLWLPWRILGGADVFGGGFKKVVPTSQVSVVLTDTCSGVSIIGKKMSKI